MGDRAVGKILAICISEKKGTQKKPIESARLVEEWGIEGDAHVGKWHRQVSMLSFEKIEAFRSMPQIFKHYFLIPSIFYLL